MQLRLLSYNIHGCIGRSGKEDEEAVLEVIRDADADVVALQEVQDEDAADLSFLRSLHGLGYASVLHGPTMRKEKGHYGNVLMTRHPVLEEDRIDLSYPGKEPRGAIRARIDVGGRDVEIVATHLGLGFRERIKQLEILDRSLPDWRKDSQDAIRIGMGDFNEWMPGSRTRRLLHGLFGDAPRVATFPSMFPLIALDRIFVRPRAMLRELEVMTGAGTAQASDHLPLLAVVGIDD